MLPIKLFYLQCPENKFDLSLSFDFFQVQLHRKFQFLHSKRTHEGVPIIASNMDTVGTFEMASALAKVQFLQYDFRVRLREWRVRNEPDMKEFVKANSALKTCN